MNEIQVRIEDGLYTCDTGITVDMWKEMLHDPQIGTPERLDMLKKFYNEPEHKSTCRTLADKYDNDVVSAPQSYNALNTNMGKAVCKQLDMKINRADNSGDGYWIVTMEGRNLDNGWFEWKLRAEVIEALECLPELALFVSEESQVTKNLMTLEDYLAREEYHDFAVEKVCKGKTLLTYNIGSEIHFAPSRLTGYVNSSKEKSEKSTEIDGRDTNSNFKKVFGWKPIEYDNLNLLFENYCSKLGSTANASKHSFIETGINLKEKPLGDYERFKKLLEYFITHYRYFKSGETSIKGYIEYILPHIQKNDFVATGYGWKYQPILGMIASMNTYDRLPDTEILLTCRKNQFGNVGPKTCYMQIAETNPAINIMLVGQGTNVDGLKISLYNYDTDKTWDDKEYYSLNDLGLYDKNAEITDGLKDMFDNFVKLYDDMVMNDKNLQAKKKMEGIYNLLTQKKNIILQGAPGTGKTYTTTSLAVRMCTDDFVDYADHAKVMEEYERLREDGRIAFCTFHQSMDYEDFVEGLKPVVNGGAVEYKTEDGVFKRICDNARTTGTTSITECIDKYLQTIKGYQNRKTIPTISGKSQLLVWWKEGNKTISTRSVLSESDQGEEYTPSPLNIEKVKLQALGEGIENNWQQYSQAFINAVRREYQVDEQVSDKPFVLIIDEINRGNVSKIFGELITLLESDKRDDGKHQLHTIHTILPYSKMGYSVPANLYIIGTMNTTDRSTGTIDYAVRRRFAFVTLESSADVIAEWYYSKGLDPVAKDASLCLFYEINGRTKSETQSFIIKHKAADFEIEDLKVGHSYFMAENLESLKMKMKFEVVPLIKEYIKDGILRGYADDEKYFEKWVNAECKNVPQTNSDIISDVEG